ncbi:outer membrane lipoprotein carrier protein LolA [Thermovibrio ammonificans HB-1]|uniref:Outer membrane lipoprotein carrier protein LolA n=1 Tax=Thermovibrio ammonificans (strain DSM 15698 / JCM 12110 / HB-1) TaxID=648996 RepID=E8T2U0_THEA1|nr:outer membrane lipoprotein carrier protein LolA [Thermovibrio ammonificans]ADU97149.1 outer membrane lipoprotein carrier protein LolA [Thermovibrio ammonificans HB-1]
MRKSTIALTLLITIPAAAHPSETPLKELSGAESLKIEFRQKTKLPVAGDEVTLYRGVIYYKRPLKFLWEYTRGSNLRIISNGKEVETRFGDGQCQVEPLNPENALFPLLLLAENYKTFKKYYTVKEEKEGKNLQTFTVEPKFKDPFFTKITFTFFKGKLKEVKTVQADGTESTYLIDSVKKNPKLPDSLFKLPPCR